MPRVCSGLYKPRSDLEGRFRCEEKMFGLDKNRGQQRSCFLRTNLNVGSLPELVDDLGCSRGRFVNDQLRCNPHSVRMGMVVVYDYDRGLGPRQRLCCLSELVQSVRVDQDCEVDLCRESSVGNRDSKILKELFG